MTRAEIEAQERHQRKIVDYETRIARLEMAMESLIVCTGDAATRRKIAEQAMYRKVRE